MTAEELILRVMQRLGIDPADKGSNRALVLALNLAPRDASQGAQNVRRWRKGETDPAFETTLVLLDAAGLLRDRPVALREEASAEIARADLLDEQSAGALAPARPHVAQGEDG